MNSSNFRSVNAVILELSDIRTESYELCGGITNLRLVTCLVVIQPMV
jgi:hypothetical protein